MRCGVPVWALHPGRVCPCMRALLRVLGLMMDPSWRGTADALWNMLEDDYNGEWLSLSLSSVCTSPPTPSPSLLFLAPFPFSTRGQVSPRLRCQGCQSPTQWVQGNCCQETVIRLLGTWSCAHNSHFVAWKHTRAQNHINSFATSTTSSHKFI